MSLQIVIPTHRRVRKQTTLQSIPAAIRHKVLLVASDPAEAAALRTFHGNVTHAPVGSIAEKRQWIMENVEADRIIMLDDDMYFFGRCPVEHRTFDGGRWRPAEGHKVLSRDYAPDNALIDMFRYWAALLRNFAHVGLSSRMGNDTMRHEVETNGRMMHAIGYDRKKFLRSKIRFDDVQCREDFHVTLSLLKAGYSNKVIYSYCCSPGAYGAPGGASTERTIEQSNEQAEYLATLHPGLVRVRERSYLGTPRKEVTIQWKKAYARNKP